MLIQNSSAHKIGFLESEHVTPLCGNDAFKLGGGLVLNVEVFQVHGTNITIIQQRTRCLKGHELSYATELLMWMKSSGFESILLLSGADAKDKVDKQILTESNPFAIEYISNEIEGELSLKDKMSSLGFKKVMSLVSN